MEMSKELNRLATFCDWSGGSKVSPIQLARYGFYYSRDTGDTVCFSCNAVVRDWNDNETPLEKHSRLSPNCVFLSENHNRSNLFYLPPASTEASKVRELPTGPQDPINSVLSSALRRATTNNPVSGNRSYHTDCNSRTNLDTLRMESERLRTFGNWPSTAVANPKALAREGFFYIGMDDKVQCAFCRGYLRKWQSNDNPSEEHRKHFPDCPFVRGMDVGNVPVSGSPTECVGTPVPGVGHSSALPGASHSSALPGVSHSSALPGVSHSSASTSGSPSSENAHSGSNGFAKSGSTLMDLLSSSYVRVVIDMGYPLDLVMTAIEKKRSETGTDFLNAESLLEAIFQLEEGTTASKHNSSAGTLTTGFPLSSLLSSAPAAASSSTHVQLTNQVTEFPPSQATRFPIDSGIFLSGSSTRSYQSLPALKSELLPSTVSSHLSPFLGSTFKKSGTSSLAPTGSSELPTSSAAAMATAAVTMATAAEVAAGVQGGVQSKNKGKRKRNKKTLLTSNAAGSELTQNKTSAEANAAPGDEESQASASNVPDDETSKYLEENRQLREARTCKVCMDMDVDTVFLPCGHLVCCAMCSPLLKNCPICRTYIRGTVKASFT